MWVCMWWITVYGTPLAYLARSALMHRERLALSNWSACWLKKPNKQTAKKPYSCSCKKNQDKHSSLSNHHLSWIQNSFYEIKAMKGHKKKNHFWCSLSLFCYVSHSNSAFTDNKCYLRSFGVGYWHLGTSSKKSA